MTDLLIPKHGGYRNLKTFQLAQLIYDLTVRFCDCYISKRSRTHDQMVQAARSGVQNIAEGSLASATSKKTELKLTNVARASLEELRLDYEDFLRHRLFSKWAPRHPALMRFKAKKCATVDDVRGWVKSERNGNTDGHGQSPTNTDTEKKGEQPKSVSVCECPCQSLPESALVTNAALSLINLCCYLLTRQLEFQADAFMRNGGFTERLYKMRSGVKKIKNKPSNL